MAKREFRDTAVALLNATVRVIFVVVVVGGSWLAGSMLVAEQTFYHGDNSIPFVYSVTVGFAAAGIAGFIVHRILR